MSSMETQFIQREQAKLDARLLRQLKAVKSHRIVSRNVIETLWVNGLVEFGGPSATCQYNHDRLTEKGNETLLALMSA